MIQVVENLPKTLNSNPSTAKKKKRKAGILFGGPGVWYSHVNLNFKKIYGLKETIIKVYTFLPFQSNFPLTFSLLCLFNQKSWCSWAFCHENKVLNNCHYILPGQCRVLSRINEVFYKKRSVKTENKSTVAYAAAVSAVPDMCWQWTLEDIHRVSLQGLLRSQPFIYVNFSKVLIFY
jgi:hypothetical protein